MSSTSGATLAEPDTVVAGGSTIRLPVGLLFAWFSAIAWIVAMIADFRVVLSAMAFVGFVAAVVGLQRPTIGLLGIGMLCTLDAILGPLLLHGGILRWNTINYWLLFVVVVFAPLLVRRGGIHVALLMALLALLALGLANSVGRMDGIQHIFGGLTLLGVLVYFLRATRERGAWYWLGVVNGITAIGAGLALVLNRSQLEYINPNVWSHVPVAGLLSASLAFAAGGLTRRRQWILTALAFGNGSLVFLSGSRGNLAVVAIGLVGFTIMIPSLSRKVTAGVVGCLLALGVASAFPAFADRTIGRLELLTDSDRSPRVRTSGRSDLALGGWYIFRDHPWGVGTGSFPTYWARLGVRRGMSTFMRGQPFSAHSAWVRTLAENGIPGVVLLAAFTGSFAIAGLRRRQPSLRIIGLIATAILAVAFFSTEFQSKVLWFFVAGTVCLLSSARHSMASR